MQIGNAASEDLKKSEWQSLPEFEEKQNAESTSEYSFVCDIWKDNVHKLVTKAEFQMPIYLQAYSNVHSEFLHCIDNLFGTCYIWQKQYFDRLGIDQKIINAYGKLCESGMSSTMDMMDIYANYKKLQADIIIDSMKIGNNYLHWWIDVFGRAVSFWNFQPKS